MGYTNVTPILQLPQFIGTDTPSWLTDINQAFAQIDATYGKVKQTSDNSQDMITQYSQTIQNLQTNYEELSDTLDCVKTTTQNNVADINTINEKINNINSMFTVVRPTPILGADINTGVVYVSYNKFLINIQAILTVKSSYNQVAFVNECGLPIFRVNGNPLNLTTQTDPTGFVLVGLGWVNDSPYSIGAIYGGEQTTFYVTWPSANEGPSANSVVKIESTWLIGGNE